MKTLLYDLVIFGWVVQSILFFVGAFLAFRLSKNMRPGARYWGIGKLPSDEKLTEKGQQLKRWLNRPWRRAWAANLLLMLLLMALGLIAS